MASINSKTLSVINKLEEDPFVSARELSEELSLPRAQVLEILNEISDKNLAHVLAIANLNALEQSLVFFRAEIATEGFEETIDKISALQETMVVAATNGEFDLMICSRLNSNQKAMDLFERLQKIPGVRLISVEPMINVYFIRANRLSFSNEAREQDIETIKSELKNDLSHFAIDDLDIAIMSELRRDGRKSLRSLAKTYDVSEGTIRYRLNSLRKKNLIKVVTATRPDALDLSCWAVVELEVESDKLSKVVNFLSKKDWTVQLGLSTGRKNLKCITLTKDQAELTKLSANTFRRMEGVRKLTVSQIIEIYKVDTRWGVF